METEVRLGLEIAVGNRPTLHGPGVTYCDWRECDVRPFVKCDVFEPLPFADATFFLVRANHILEHCSHRFTGKVLDQWCQVLRGDGVLWLEVPDFQWQAERLVKDPGDESVAVLAYGYQDYANDSNVHRNGFTSITLSRRLVDVGMLGFVAREGGCLIAWAMHDIPGQKKEELHWLYDYIRRVGYKGRLKVFDKK